MVRCTKSSSSSLLVDAPTFCAAADPAPHLAVLGVFSTSNARSFRDAARSTWLNADPLTLAKFVLRGASIEQGLLEEARDLDDIIFVDAKDQLSCKAAPLTKLLLWLQCATHAWPRATFIGKADDDIWASLTGITLRLAGALAAATSLGANTTASPPCIVWGLFF